MPVEILLALAVVSAAAVAFLLLRERQLRRRRCMLAEILDLADALEHELLECRDRLREVPALTPSLPSAARATLAAEPQVQDALRDLLAHRLWLRDHADEADSAKLAAARDALRATRDALHLQLERLACVRSDLADARAEFAARVTSS